MDGVDRTSGQGAALYQRAAPEPREMDVQARLRSRLDSDLEEFRGASNENALLADALLGALSDASGRLDLSACSIGCDALEALPENIASAFATLVNPTHVMLPPGMPRIPAWIAALPGLQELAIPYCAGTVLDLRAIRAEHFRCAWVSGVDLTTVQAHKSVAVRGLSPGDIDAAHKVVVEFFEQGGDEACGRATLPSHPYFSNRLGTKDTNLNGHAEFASPARSSIVCRHLALYWLWQSFKEPTQHLVERINDRMSTTDAISRNLSPDLEQRYNELVRSDQVDLVGRSRWGDYIQGQFGEMQVGDERRILVCTSEHAMGMLLKVKEGTPPYGKSYVAEFYDPNRTLTHVRTVESELDYVKSWKLDDWICRQEWREYFEHPQIAGSDNQVLECFRLPDDLPAHDVAQSLPRWPAQHSPSVVCSPQEHQSPQFGNLLMRHNLPGVSRWMLDVASIQDDKFLAQTLAATDDVRATELLSSKDRNGHAGLYCAMHSDSADAVTAYFDGLSMLAEQGKLSDDQLADLLASKSPSGNPCLYEAMAKGNVLALTAYIAGISKLVENGTLDRTVAAELLAARYEGMPGLCTSMDAGRAETVAAYIAGVSQLVHDGNLDGRQAAELLSSKDPKGNPGLYRAMHYDRADAVAAYIRGVSHLVKGGKLQPDAAAQLLTAENDRGVASLRNAISRGSAKACAAYLSGLSQLVQDQAFDFDTAADLLALRNPDGSPVLFSLLTAADPAAQTAYLTSIAQLLENQDVDPALTCELLAAKNSRWTPSLALAMRDGNPNNAVDRYFAGLVQAARTKRLSASQLVELVAARNNLGFPSLHVAMRNNAAPAVTAYFKGLSQLLAELDTMAAAELLGSQKMLASDGGDPALCTALEKGNAEAVAAYIAGVSHLDATQLPRLLSAKSRFGKDNGLHSAHERGHTQAVAAYRDGISQLVKQGKLDSEQAATLLADPELD